MDIINWSDARLLREVSENRFIDICDIKTCVSREKVLRILNCLKQPSFNKPGLKSKRCIKMYKNYANLKIFRGFVGTIPGFHKILDSDYFL